jgi:hypothetical protein
MLDQEQLRIIEENPIPDGSFSAFRAKLSACCQLTSDASSPELDALDEVEQDGMLSKPLVANIRV